MGIFAIKSEDNNVTNRIVGSSGVRNVRNERPPLQAELGKIPGARIIIALIAILLFIIITVPTAVSGLNDPCYGPTECGGRSATNLFCGEVNYCWCCNNDCNGDCSDACDGNCTWWAWDQACWHWGVPLNWCGDAHTWNDSAQDPINGYKVSSVPAKNTIAGSESPSHVAWVIHVTDDKTQVTVEEMTCGSGCGDCSYPSGLVCTDPVNLGGGVGRCTRPANRFDWYIYPKLIIENGDIFPNSAAPGDILTFVYSIRNPGKRAIENIRLGAQIRKNSPQGSWIDDPANDGDPVSINPGTNDYSRQFKIPTDASEGYYDAHWVILEDTSGTWLDELTKAPILNIEGQTLSVSLSANPPSGNAPLNGVDLTATVSGTATGTINYTFYCNRSDSGTNITYPNSFKIDERNPDGTGGTVGTWGNATGYSGGTTFTVYDVCNYTTTGTYTAKVIAERGSAPPAEDRFTVTVSAPSLSYITISGSTQVNENSGAQYTCTAYYSDGSSSNVTSSASWSENSSYASISSSGYLTTSSVSSDQSCTITATYGEKSDTHNVTIKNVPATLSYITISGPTQVNESSGAQYTCTAYYSDGSNSNVTSSASWSENSSYASISSSGYLTTSSVSSDQSCTITATYGEKSDTHNVTIKNVADTTPPTPNPMTWATQPYPAGSTSISMVATTATDSESPPVSYFFDFVSSPTGGSGGSDSSWQSSMSYTDTGLQPNHQYGYRVKARDSASTPNETDYSSIVYKYTHANAPGTSSFSNVTQTSIRANWTANGNPSGTQYYCENTTQGTNSGWTTNTYWNSTGLTCGTSYTFRVKARNGDGTQTGWTNLGYFYTQPCLTTPTVTTTAVSSITSNSAFSGGNVTSNGGTSVTARGVCWSTSANPTTSDNHTSDGTGTGSFTSSITGLSPNTTYHVRAYATNSEGTGYGSDEMFSTNCSGDVVVLESVTFYSGTTCECVGTTSITIGTGVTVQSGATVTFTAPTVKLQPGFHAESGAVVRIKQP